MSALSAADLAYMRATIAELMPDTCVLQLATLTADGQGGQRETWAAVTGGTVACRLDNGSGNRANVAQSVQPFSAWVLTLPQGTGITTAHRVVHGGETYSVLAVSVDGSWLACERASLQQV